MKVGEETNWDGTRRFLAGERVLIMRRNGQMGWGFVQEYEEDGISVAVNMQVSGGERVGVVIPTERLAHADTADREDRQ